MCSEATGGRSSSETAVGRPCKATNCSSLELLRVVVLDGAVVQPVLPVTGIDSEPGDEGQKGRYNDSEDYEVQDHRYHHFPRLLRFNTFLS